MTSTVTRICLFLKVLFNRRMLDKQVHNQRQKNNRGEMKRAVIGLALLLLSMGGYAELQNYMENPGYRNIRISSGADSETFSTRRAAKHTEHRSRRFIGGSKYTGGNMYAIDFDFSRSSEIIIIYNLHADLEVIIRKVSHRPHSAYIEDLKRWYRFVSDKLLLSGQRVIAFEAIDTKIYVKIPQHGEVFTVEYIHDNFQRRYDALHKTDKHKIPLSESFQFDYAEPLPLKPKYCFSVFQSPYIYLSSDVNISILEDPSLAYRHPGLCSELKNVTMEVSMPGYHPYTQRLVLREENDVVLWMGKDFSLKRRDVEKSCGSEPKLTPSKAAEEGGDDACK